MSERKVLRAQSSLMSQIEAISEAVQLGEPHLDPETVDFAATVISRAQTRRQLSADHVVIGLFGATGSGKSSLFNEMAGAQLARTGVIRPTTTKTIAAIWNPDGSGELLDWLEVDERHVVDSMLGTGRASRGTGTSGGLILLDLPDMDSTALGHHEIVDRLSGQVDVMVWVLDPQKYADASIHRGYLDGLSSLEGNLLVVLNQIDLVAPSDRAEIQNSLTGLLAKDGLRGLEILPVSSKTGEGIDALRARIAKLAENKALSIRRLKADVDQVVHRLVAELGVEQVNAPGKLDQAELEQGIAAAHGVNVIADAAAKSYLLRASSHTGWPLTSWLVRFKNDPLKRMNLGRNHERPELALTSRPPLSAAQSAGIRHSVNTYLSRASDGLPAGWTDNLRASAADRLGTMDQEIDLAIASTDLAVDKKSWWWPLTRVLQWASIVVALGGALWLGALAVAGYLQFAVLEPPKVEGLPIPTLMLLLGLLLGIVLGIAGSFVNRMVAKMKRKRVHRNLERSVAGVVRQNIVNPVAAHLDQFNSYADLINQAAKKAD